MLSNTVQVGIHALGLLGAWYDHQEACELVLGPETARQIKAPGAAQCHIQNHRQLQHASLHTRVAWHDVIAECAEYERAACLHRWQ